MLFVGDDWAEDHHDVELMDPAGRRLAKARLPEGVAGIARLHAMIGEHLDEDDAEVRVGIETDRGPWVAALVAAGYVVYAVNPLQAARYRERHGVSGAKSDPADAHILADMVRTDAHQLRPGCRRQRGRRSGESRCPSTQDADLGTHPPHSAAAARAARVLSGRVGGLRRPRRARHAGTARQGARSGLGGEVDPQPNPGRAQTRPPPRHRHQDHPHPGRAARRAAGPRRGDHRRLRGHHPRPVAVLVTLNEQIKTLQGQVEAHFGRHPDAEIIMSQPGMGLILGARVLAEFGDAPGRYADAKSRKNYAGTSPITRASGKKKTVHARFVHNDRLIDALMPRPNPPCRPRPEPAPTTTSNAPAGSATTPPYASSPTGSSASCTAASKPARTTTKPPPGRTTTKINKTLLDI